jgi:hypothetical protein
MMVVVHPSAQKKKAEKLPGKKLKQKSLETAGSIGRVWR